MKHNFNKMKDVNLTVLIITLVLGMIFFKVIEYILRSRPLSNRDMVAVERSNVNVDTRQDFNIPQPACIEDGILPSLPVSVINSRCSSIQSQCLKTYIPTQRARSLNTLPENASHGERMCSELCKEIFGEEPLYNFRDITISNPDTKRALEFDMFYPQYNFAIEYNGEQHYRDVPHFESLHFQQFSRDHIKAVLAHDNGICLVIVPYTYNKEEARSVIYNAALRMDLLVKTN